MILIHHMETPLGRLTTRCKSILFCSLNALVPADKQDSTNNAWLRFSNSCSYLWHVVMQPFRQCQTYVWFSQVRRRISHNNATLSTARNLDGVRFLRRINMRNTSASEQCWCGVWWWKAQIFRTRLRCEAFRTIYIYICLLWMQEMIQWIRFTYLLAVLCSTRRWISIGKRTIYI